MVYCRKSKRVKKNLIFLIFALLFLNSFTLLAQDTIKHVTDTFSFHGQVSIWGNYNFKNSLPVQTGGRYIPILDYGIKFTNKSLIDFEGAANIFGTLSTHPFDTLTHDGSITPYRAWMRYSTSQFEIRIGLQKINFGSATLLSPLMWFDQLDPRDPLQLTNGVWGLLSRYYFLNNTNIWLWCLYDNDKPRPWDIGKTNKNIPEPGARFQFPVPKGEMALSFHHRTVDTRDMGNGVPAFADLSENRIGLDGKLDFGVGLWFEGCWINKSKNIGNITNQEILNIGVDNTFKIGRGLNTTFEQLLVASDEYAFAFSNNIVFSALSISYPLGIVDNLNAIIYYDWSNNTSYNFVNWNHNFKYLTLYLMGYWNPQNFLLPQQGNIGNSYSGKGVQVMLVYNY